MNVYAIQHIKKSGDIKVFSLYKENNEYVWRINVIFPLLSNTDYLEKIYGNPVVISQARVCQNGHLKFLESDMSKGAFTLKELKKRLYPRLKG